MAKQRTSGHQRFLEYISRGGIPTLPDRKKARREPRRSIGTSVSSASEYGLELLPTRMSALPCTKLYRSTMPKAVKKLLGPILLLFMAVGWCSAKTLVSIAIPNKNGVIRTGTTLSYSVVCTYSDASTDDCTFIGGATWSTPSSALTIVGSGGTATVQWTGADPYTYLSAFMAQGIVVATAGGLTDSGILLAQSVLHSDVFTIWTTPASNIYTDNQTGTALPINVVVGATVAIGAGFVASFNGSSGNPYPGCNWTSSNNSFATVTQFGLATAVAPGSVTITCNSGGNGTFNSGSGHTTFTFNVVAPTLTTQTWYVRPGGGTPYVSSGATPAGQCNGHTNVDYPGTGVNQNCAMGNLRYLWTDQVTTSQELWMIGPGDTVIVAQNSAGYNLGPDARGADRGGSGHTPVNCTNSAQCYMPTIPSGTFAQHTRILGENYASCTSDSVRTQVSPTWAAQTAWNVKDSQFVDIACFAVTQHAQCGGNGFFVNACTNAQNFGQWGIWESALTASVTYTDMFIHGLQTQGIFGATGAGVVANRVHIRGIPNAGINMDDGSWVIGNISVAGGFTMNNSITEFIGCVEEFPVVHNYPYIECRDQATAGTAPDGFGTASTTGSWSFDHDIWQYNYQDGLDLLHSGLQSLSITNSQSIGNDGNPYKIGAATNVVFRGNLALQNCNRISAAIGDEPLTALYPNPSGTFGHSGLSMIWNSGNASVGGPGTQVVVAYTGGTFGLTASTTNYFWVDITGTIQHNTTGFPAGTLGAQLGIVTAGASTLSVNNFGLPAFCRAGGDVTMQWAWNGTYTFQNNALIGYPDIMLDYGTSPGSDNVSTAVTTLQNNTFLSYTAPITSSQGAAALCAQSGSSCTTTSTSFPPHQGWATRSNNTWYNMRSNPAVVQAGETFLIDPKFISEVNPLVNVTVESTLDGYANTPQTNFQPSSISALLSAGTAYSGIPSTDIFGRAYSAPPPIGAVNQIITNSFIYNGNWTLGGTIRLIH
jgi:hypothetical protein